MADADGLAVVKAHLQRLQPLGARAYLHGSLALGGYHHGVSDQDLIVVLGHPLTSDERQLVDESHRRAGPMLAASYLEDPNDLEHEAPTWTHGWSGNRRVSLITRAELHHAHPDEWTEIPDVPRVVAAEVKRAWGRELRAPRTWLKTEYVDLSLTSCVRALLTQDSGELVSKDSAIGHLEVFGIPDRLARAVATRRQGLEAQHHNRISRGIQTRREVVRLLGML